jgi:D-xylose transport system permease protein
MSSDLKKVSAAAPPAPTNVAERDAVVESGNPVIRTMKKLAAGELGSVRVLIVLALIWLIFGVSNDNFLTPGNLTNLTLQIAAVGTISVGVVLVLLLGEIDLSVGAVSGLAAAVVAVLSVKHGWNAYAAMAAGLLVGAGIGLFQGTVSTRLVIPTFVVTLAGLLAWQGAQLAVLGDTGTVNIEDDAILNLAGVFLDDWLGLVVAAVVVGALVFAEFGHRRKRGAAGLVQAPVVSSVFRLGGAAVALFGGVLIVNDDRGVPLAFVILVAIVANFHILLTRTKFGRHVFAVGGNAEAARRAGIPVARVRTIVFMLASTLAAFGGILAASRLFAVNQSSGGSDLLLLAIAGPVIAGTSLFGGRGSVWGALLGALVIGSISNGMDLLAFTSSVKFMVTGAVLLGAVALDAATTRNRTTIRT